MSKFEIPAFVLQGGVSRRQANAKSILNVKISKVCLYFFVYRSIIWISFELWALAFAIVIHHEKDRFSNHR
jgi:hypothetical protein